MPDGVKLAADLYLPAGGQPTDRFPVLLEYLPIGRPSRAAATTASTSYFVRRGYAVARVDIRGTGNSEGRLVAYEYSEQEQTDGLAVIDWLARQPFSTGKSGCSASPGAASTPYTWPCETRPHSRRSSRWTRATTSIRTTSTSWTPV
jgi:putative CocE/NonD family hydrolase